MPRRTNRDFSKNKINWDYDFSQDEEPTYERKLEFTKYMWNLLGIPGTPKEEDVNGASLGLETRMMIKKNISNGNKIVK